MKFIFDSLLVKILIVICVAILVRCKLAFNYWKKRKVPQVEEPTILFGNLSKIIFHQVYPGCMAKIFYDEAKVQGHKHFGSFWCSTPKYTPVDLDYIKNMLQRDFSYFTERGFYYNEKDDPLSANLFAVGGEKWRMLRKKLSPAYTSGKLRTIFDSVLQCSYQMQDAVEEICKNKQTVNVKNISECFTVDVIGSSAFGLECNSFKSPEAEFLKQGRKIFNFNIPRILRTLLAFSYPNIARRVGIRLFDSKLTEFFVNVVRDSLNYRKSNNIVRKDFLQLLLDLKDENTENQNFTLEEITAQVFIFFAAGFETSSITLAFALYEISTNSNVQNTVRKEINQVLTNHKGKITYEAIKDMKYLNQVVEETLRKYPPVSFITRVAVEDYQIPGTDVVIEKGIESIISILGVHHDPEYYPYPDKFDPERFSDENKQQRLPFTYMPFGEGPRKCIGLRFGLMQIKVGLAVLLRSFKFFPNSKTEVPLKMDPFSFTLTPKNGIFLDIKQIR